MRKSSYFFFPIYFFIIILKAQEKSFRAIQPAVPGRSGSREETSQDIEVWIVGR